MYVGSLPPASNRAQYVQAFQVIDENTGDAINLTAYAVQFEVRDKQTFTTELTLTESSGIDVSDAASGIFEITITPTQMRTLDPKVYDVGCTITLDSDSAVIIQYIAGTLPVFDGVMA